MTLEQLHAHLLQHEAFLRETVPIFVESGEPLKRSLAWKDWRKNCHRNPAPGRTPADRRQDSARMALQRNEEINAKSFHAAEKRNRDRAEAIAEVPTHEPIYLLDHIVFKRADSKRERDIRETLVSILQRQDEMIKGFVAEKTAEGFSIEDINGLYAIESFTVPYAYTDSNGRLRIQSDIKIVERIED